MNGFAVWLGIGATLGLWRLARSVPPRQASAWVNAGLIVLAAGLVGARLTYAAGNWTAFARQPLDIMHLGLGGLSWPGAVAGAWLAVLGLALVYRSQQGLIAAAGQVADRLYPLLPPLAVTAWLGLWQAGSAYGPELSEEAWWGVPSLDESGIYTLRWPLQPLAALSLLAIFVLLEARVKPLRPAGRLSGLAWLGLLLNLLAASLLRADPVPVWRNLPLDTWMGLALLAGLLIFMGVSGLARVVSYRSRRGLNAGSGGTSLSKS